MGERDIKSEDVKQLLDAINARINRECWTPEYTVKLRRWRNALEELLDNEIKREEADRMSKVLRRWYSA